MVISNGNLNDANDVLNVYHHGSNVLIGKTGTIYIPVYINNAIGDTNVKLAIWGKATGASATTLVHGVSGHDHGELELNTDTDNLEYLRTQSVGGAWTTNKIRANGGDEASDNTIGRDGYSTSLPYTAVPQAVEIWIDGTQYTSTIGDENSKGATMYDSTNNDWGVDGTTEWDTGWLTLTDIITWTAGWHYIELKETGGTGGTLIYQVAINTGTD